MGWTVTPGKKVLKALARKGGLPLAVTDALALLMKDIELNGPVRGNWPNYSKLSDTKHHCHLKKGKPTYVACWEETAKGVHVEVYYAGTHEKAPY